MHDADYALIRALSGRLQHNVGEVERAYSKAARNVRTVLRRQDFHTFHPTTDHPVCQLLGEEQLLKALGTLLPLELALFTLARIYDECHMTLCMAISWARKGKGQPHHDRFLHDPCVDVRPLTDQLGRHKEVVENQILLEEVSDGSIPIKALWKPIPPMSFDHLPRLSRLSGRLPGEKTPGLEYAGVGGGGGSDIISASLLGHLLRRHDKQMNMLISTRTWATGSQGKEGSKLGIKREIYNHGGPAQGANGRPVPGTFRVQPNTYTEGRDLETIPLPHHSQIFIVLDQGESRSDIPESDKADLRDQFGAVLSQASKPIDTVLIVDTGGDVFGADDSGGTTPDQDYRVQRALSGLSSQYNLVTAVVSPGVDAPIDAPQKALKAGGMVYRPSEDEQKMLLDLLIREYKMDGSDPTRFGKTILALQARLRGVAGWTSLDLPAYVVDTWDNPWNSFVYIRECMCDIVLMPTSSLLPLIEPSAPQ